MKYFLIIHFVLTVSLNLTGQNKMSINENKVIHLISKEKITYLQVGNPDLILAEIIAQHSNLVRVKATGEFEKESSLSIVSDGKMYSIRLNYGKVQKNSFHLKDLKGVPADLYVGGLLREEDLKFCTRMILDKKSKGTNVRKCKSDGIHFSVRNIYLKNSALFFELEIRNKTDMDYDVEGFHWWITDKKRLKATNTQEYQIHPVYQYYGIQSVPAQSKIREVFVLPKFTITNQRILRIELREKALGNTGRKLSLDVKNKDIIKARSL
jgi:conjugative transposon TraN protein